MGGAGSGTWVRIIQTAGWPSVREQDSLKQHAIRISSQPTSLRMLNKHSGICSMFLNTLAISSIYRLLPIVENKISRYRLLVSWKKPLRCMDKN